ncbi:CHAT domain-containing protein [Nocardioides speluncae]|uniref:CHAT domain-containing protein n=1 Tax=Nocardioides speluncae TaxID=2670337 RepID=UPI000D69A233|nr:CHAT domain-containing protein [Nocardioides speluncae]
MTGLDAGRALLAAGIAANEEMRPRVGRRKLRAALRVLGVPTDAEGRQLRSRILVSLAMAESEVGDTLAGLARLDEAKADLAPEQRGLFHAQRAILLRRTGRDEQAATEYAAALAIVDERADPVAAAKIHMNRAVLHIAAARLTEARADLAETRRLADVAGDEVTAAKALHNLGYVDYVAGDLPATLATYDEVEAAYERLAPGVLPMLSLDRARVLLAAGLATEADRELADAIPALHRQESQQDEAEGLLARAEAALLTDRPGDASELAAEAEKLLRRRDNPRWVARAELLNATAALAAAERAPFAVAVAADHLATRLRSLGLAEDGAVAELVSARAWVAAGEPMRARGQAGERGSHAERLETTLLRHLARAEYAAATGDVAAAMAERRRGLERLHRVRGRLGALDLRGGAAVRGRELAQGGLEAALAAGQPAAILAWAERTRAQSLLFAPARPPVDGGVDSAAWEELRAVSVTLAEAELSGVPAERLRARREALRRRLRRSTWAVPGAGEAARRARLADVRARLGEGRVLVLLIAGGHDDLHALVVTTTSARLLPLGSRAAAEEATLRVRSALDAQAGRALPAALADAMRAATARDLDDLEAQLLTPLAAVLGDRELVVVPTGGLTAVPWSALPSLAGRPVTVASSASTWVARTAPASGPTLLVGGPRIARGSTELAAIEGIATGVPVIGRLDGSAATIAATRKQWEEADVAHVAAHGHHAADNPLFSGLELADGLLMGYDLLAARRTPPLVILSACDLGLHDTRPGDESLGVTTALLAAGAATVVASVARVADEVAERVMVGFHRRLAAGDTPAAALAAATAGEQTGFCCFGAG